MEWYVAEKLSEHIYALQSTGICSGTWTDGGYNRNIASTWNYYSARDLYNEIKSVEADGGRDTSSGAFDKTLERSGLYLVPLSKLHFGQIVNPNATNGDYMMKSDYVGIIQSTGTELYAEGYKEAFLRNREKFIQYNGYVCVGSDYNDKRCVISSSVSDFAIITFRSDYPSDCVIAPAFNVDDRKIKIIDGVITAQ